VKYHNEGLTLWYGTADTPIPRDTVDERHGLSVTFAVHPPNPSNRAIVHYRVDGGVVQTVPALSVRTDHAQGKHYFRAGLPDFWQGERVEYLPIAFCSGRQVPDVMTASTLPASFHFRSKASNPSTGLPGNTKASSPLRGKFPFRLEYIYTATIQLNTRPEIIGETPEGLKVDWYVTGGVVAGPELNATVRGEGGDWMTIRRDGIGDINVRATLETNDGALIYVTESGFFELGKDGYRNFLDKRWPSTPALHIAPRFLTAAPQYQWLNRLQCLGVGEVRMEELIVCYDAYAVR
jgi:hypothetical protein